MDGMSMAANLREAKHMRFGPDEWTPGRGVSEDGSLAWDASAGDLVLNAGGGDGGNCWAAPIRRRSPPVGVKRVSTLSRIARSVSMSFLSPQAMW